MSEVTPTPRPQAQNKSKGLGRGLGSLLGATNEGAFGKGAEEVSKVAIQKLAEPSPPKPAPIVQDVTPASVTQVPVQTVASPSAPIVSVAPTHRVESPGVPPHLRLWQLPIEKVDPNPDQPRQIFTKEALDELAQSIREKGVIQPLLVRRRGADAFEIIAGERRWRAAQMAGLKEVPALIKDTTDQEVLELALIENIQRQDLNVIEEAEAYEFLIKKYNLTQQELAQKVGKDRATVANVLRLLQLQPKIRLMVSKGELSLGLAKVLLSIGNPKDQELMAQRAHKEALSVRALEKLVSRANEAGKTPSPQDDLRHKLAKSLEEDLQKLLGSKVNLDYADGKGKISIHFYSDQELNQVAEKLRRSWQQN